MDITMPKPKTGFINWNFYYSHRFDSTFRGRSHNPTVPKICVDGIIKFAEHNSMSNWCAKLERKTTEHPQIRIRCFTPKYSFVQKNSTAPPSHHRNGLITIIIGGNGMVRRDTWTQGVGDYIITTSSGVVLSKQQWEEMHNAIEEAQYVLSCLAKRKENKSENNNRNL